MVKMITFVKALCQFKLKRRKKPNSMCRTIQSILSVTHEMSRKTRKDLVISPVWYEMMNYKVIPIGTLWNWVSFGDTESL